jgi:hypothetical protein
MCFPIAAIGFTAAQTAMVSLSVAATAASITAQQQSAKRQAAAISAQNQQQADEIAAAAGVELGERARAARRERASMRASASESGINLGSGSFLAALQTSISNQQNDMGLITENANNRQLARGAQAKSLMSQIQMPSAASAAFQLGAAGAGAYFNVTDASGVGTDRALNS